MTTRRDFMKTAALASLLKADLKADDSSPTQYPPTAKRVIYLFQSGAPSQIDLFDYKPALEALRAKDLPDSIRKGQRLTGMTATQNQLSGRAVALQVRPARPVRRVGQRTAAAHRESGRRPLLHQVDEHRADQSRSGRHLLPDRLPARRTSQHRRVARLRTRQREPGTAGVRGHDLAGFRQPCRSAALRPPLGQRFPAQQVSGRASSAPAAIRCSTSRTRPAIDAGMRRRYARRPRPAQRGRTCTSTAIPRSPRASRNTRWRSACRPPCRS